MPIKPGLESFYAIPELRARLLKKARRRKLFHHSQKQLYKGVNIYESELKATSSLRSELNSDLVFFSRYIRISHIFAFSHRFVTYHSRLLVCLYSLVHPAQVGEKSPRIYSKWPF